MKMTTERILRERAERLARRPQEPARNDELEVVAFQLAQEPYAVETRFVREVVALKDLAPVPCTPPFVLGVINVRGEILPVFDLKRLFGMPARGLTNATRAVILRDGANEFGIVADAVLGVRPLRAADIGPPPATLTGIHAGFLRGVTPEGLVVIDAAGVLKHPAMVVNEEVPERGTDVKAYRP